MVILGIYNKCNFNCLFCLDQNRKGKGSPSLQEIKKLFKEIKKSNEDTIMLMKGESLIRKDFLEVLNEAKKCDLNVFVTTNGSMLSYYDYLVEIIEKGVVRINLSLHSHIPSIANAISRNDSCYSLQRKALENIDLFNSLKKRKEEKVLFQINTVVCKLNYKHLADLVLYLKSLLKNTDFEIKFKFMLWEGADINLYKKLLPSFVEMRPHFLKALGLLNKDRVSFTEFPLCVAPSYEWASVDLKETLSSHDLYLNSCSLKDMETYNHRIDHIFYKYEECKKCSLYTICLGVRSDYKKLNPDFNLILSKSDPQKVLSSIKRLISEINTANKKLSQKRQK